MNLRTLTRWIPLVLCVGLISCTTSLDKDSQGWVLMRYYTNEERGLSGVEPIDLGDKAQLVQEAVPGSRDEMVAATLESTTLDEFPESTGSYQGAVLSWDLYSFNTEIPELGPFPVHVDMALAGGESLGYFVALVTLPEESEQFPEKYRSVFLHTIYSLSPLE
ncbi:MAG: hypothetical protein ABUK20_12230 [Anaerolineales bacterium]